MSTQQNDETIIPQKLYQSRHVRSPDVDRSNTLEPRSLRNDRAISGVALSRSKSKLSGFQEVPPILSNGRGEFKAIINGNSSITFQLSYWV